MAGSDNNNDRVFGKELAFFRFMAVNAADGTGSIGGVVKKW